MAEMPLPPFQWPTSAAEIEAAAELVLKEATADLDEIASTPDDSLSFAKVVRPLMLARNYKTNPLVCQAKFLQHCSTDATVRAAAEEAGKKFAAFKAASRGRKDVYERVNKYSETEEAKRLLCYESHFLNAILSDFRRGGLALSDADRAELQRLLDADSACCSSYGSNLGSDATRLRFKPEELAGCPESFLKDRTDEASGDVVLSLKYPDTIPVMNYCEVEASRERLSRTKEAAYGNNLDLVAEGVQLRKKIATLLGYPSWAHFVTETRMAGSPETVTEFLGKIRSLATDGAKADLERLRLAKVKHLRERGELDPEDAAAAAAITVKAWDGSFYHHRILRQEYGADTEAVRQYFPLDHVVATTLELYQELLGLVFTEVPPGEFTSWHDEVRLFVVHDKVAVPPPESPSCTADPARGPLVGHFYLDLHPRDGKYGHAAIFHLLKRNGEQAAVDCMLCNLPATSKDGKPALLTHNDVVTFFHEFGHIMHGLCSEGDGNSTRLAKCPRDFVEAPSQMLENWCWQPAILERLSRHHETGETLPSALLDALVETKNVHESVFMLRQIYLATLDLTIHNETPPASASELQALVDRLRPEITYIENPEGANMLRNFGHLMNQYSAAYYGYMWAEVISADMFATRFEADCMNAEAGMRYRKEVLAPGGTGKIMDHLKVFLGGRAPQQEPFLRSRGILKE